MRRLTDGRAPLAATTVNAEARAVLTARDDEKATAASSNPSSKQMEMAGLTDAA